VEAVMLALTRTCDLADFPGCLTPAAWQEALAASAVSVWQAARPTRGRVWVLNRSGLPFACPLPEAVELADPLTPPDPGPVGAIFALQILDHVDAPVLFLNSWARTLCEGGLFVCTVAAWNAVGKDVARGWQGRRRIYDAVGLQKLIGEVRRGGLRVLGGTDWKYRGDVLGDHTIASVVFVKGGVRQASRD
jgi:SAM-dependent methyltransferase